MTRNRLRLIAILATLAVLAAPAAVLAAGPYTTSIAWTNTHSTPCTAAPGAVPVQIGSTVAVPCTFQEITTTVVSYTQHIPHAVYTTVNVPHTAYWTTTSQVPYTAYRQVTTTQAYTAYRTETSTRTERVWGPTTHSAWHPGHHTYPKVWSCAGVTGRYTCAWRPLPPVWHPGYWSSWTSWGWLYRTVTSTYSQPYTAYRTVTTTQAYTAYRTETFTHSRTWTTTEQVPTGAYTWTIVAAGSSTSSSSHTLRSWLDSTPLVGTSGSSSGNCGPGFCGPWYVIPIPAVNP